MLRYAGIRGAFERIVSSHHPRPCGGTDRAEFDGCSGEGRREHGQGEKKFSIARDLGNWNWVCVDRSGERSRVFSPEPVAGGIWIGGREVEDGRAGREGASGLCGDRLGGGKTGRRAEDGGREDEAEGGETCAERREQGRGARKGG